MSAFTAEIECWWVRGPINCFDAGRAVAMRIEPEWRTGTTMAWLGRGQAFSTGRTGHLRSGMANGSAPMSRDGLDLSRVSLAALVAAGLSIGLAVAFLRHAQSTPDVGPTSAALEEGFSELLGAGIGLALGSALGALSVRRGSRLLSGLLAGLLAYLVAVAPVVVFSGDVSPSESIGFAAFLLLPLGAFVLLGAVLGWFLAPFLPRDHLPRQPQQQ